MTPTSVLRRDVVASGPRRRVLEATYACVARKGLAKTTVEDAAREAGVSRATIYRQFPGGRDQLLAEMIAHEVDRFFLDLAEAVAGAETVEEVVQEALVHASRAVAEHSVLQALLAQEPERLLPALTDEAVRLLPQVAAFAEPYLRDARLRPGVRLHEAAEYVARMVLSHISAPGRWDLGDRAQVADLVRTEVLGGIVARR